MEAMEPLLGEIDDVQLEKEAEIEDTITASLETACKEEEWLTA